MTIVGRMVIIQEWLCSFYLQNKIKTRWRNSKKEIGPHMCHLCEQENEIITMLSNIYKYTHIYRYIYKIILGESPNLKSPRGKGLILRNLAGFCDFPMLNWISSPFTYLYTLGIKRHPMPSRHSIQGNHCRATTQKYSHQVGISLFESRKHELDPLLSSSSVDKAKWSVEPLAAAS